MTKDDVLILLKTTSGYLSGERISRELGVSRAAIHAAVAALRREGYRIESATRRGYRLTDAPPRFGWGEIAALLPKDRRERLLFFDSLPSTNTHAKKLAQQGAPDGLIVIANEQTAGRGRSGRSFFAPRDGGLYLSLLLRPTDEPAAAVKLTAWTAVAVSDAIAEIGGVTPDIKWINDLVLNGKKICGILTEMAVEGESLAIQHVVVGVGVNVREPDGGYDAALQPIAAALNTVCGRSIDRAELAAAVIRRLDRLRADWPRQQDAYLQAYRQRCITLGREVQIVGQGLSGVAEAIDDEFRLLVRLADGRRLLCNSGEVSIRGLCGYL